MKKQYILYIFLVVAVLAGIVILAKSSKNPAMVPSGTSTIHVVAAENFYGDIVQQLGGSHVQVTSILSDPNADPHEYESSVADAQAVANAQIVIENGLNYDAWMDKLLSASPNKNRTVLVAGNIANHKLEDNPHVWYVIDNMPTIARSVTNALKKADPVHASVFDKNLQDFVASLSPLQNKITDIHSKYANTPVALTETIYLYQTMPEGLDVLTPIAFERAIAEGNDPSADDVAKTNDQITKKQVKVLIYNEQTITPITTNIQNEAKQQNMSIVGVTETLPANMHYQSWMITELTNLEQALQQTH
ncbi:MAG TPA: zinc ABC transporter substrate-binding protein [Patescibacteria group bacterium]|nr:zinc ABC transporter substrate-binding protein [Patescibacteria group bacterium]